MTGDDTFTEDMLTWNVSIQQYCMNKHSLEGYPAYLFDLAVSILDSGDHGSEFRGVMGETNYQTPWEFARRSQYLIATLKYADNPQFAVKWMNMLLNDVDMWLQQIVCYMFIKQTTKIQDKWSVHYSKLFLAEAKATFVPASVKPVGKSNTKK